MMAKPLISSTLFSFPKLLLWSLPLLFILLYTYLVGDLKGTVGTILSFVKNTEEYVYSMKPIKHDEFFVPHFVLRVTEGPFTQSCIPKTDVILINGTSPGPEIRLAEGKVYWIRVYNDMDNQNLTMVYKPLIHKRPRS